MEQINWQRGERWLTQVFEFEPLLRAELARASAAAAALAKTPYVESKAAPSESALDELLCDTYARILTAASEADFMPPCLKSFALKVAREVAGVPDPDGAVQSAAAELERLASIVRGLPEVTRRVFTLRKVYECPQEEIATRLKLPLVEVEMHLIAGAKACSRALGLAPSPAPAAPSGRSPWWRAARRR